jgi:peroxiredoxin
MPATLYLFACALATAQPAPAPSAEWHIQPHLVRGQELLYHGTFTQQDEGPGVRFQQSVRMETRVFVLDTEPRGTAEVAFFTILKGQAAPGEKVEPSAIRLETAKVETNGRLVPPKGVSLGVNLDGPPTIECGAFVEVAGGWAGPERSWDVSEPDRPSRHWHVDGTDVIGTVRCARLTGTQQSDDWEHPTPAHTAWKRTDTVWLDIQAGFVRKLERVIEQRDVTRRNGGQRLVLKCELDRAMQYPSHLADDCAHDIQQAVSLGNTVAALLPKAGQAGPRPFESVLAKINFTVEHDPPTPYRESLNQVRRLAEAGRRGETPPSMRSTEPEPVIAKISIGKPAPDFLAAHIGETTTVHMHDLIGHPMVLVFYSPTASAEPVLHFAQKIRDEHREAVTVVGLAVTDNDKAAIRQRDDLRLSIPILSGNGLTLTYGVEATPKIVVVDANGIIQGDYLGWGPETPFSVKADLVRCRK